MTSQCEIICSSARSVARSCGLATAAKVAFRLSYKPAAANSFKAFVNCRVCSCRLVGEVKLVTQRSTAPARERVIFASNERRFHRAVSHRHESLNSKVHKCGRTPLSTSQSRNRARELYHRSCPRRQAVTSALVKDELGARVRTRRYGTVRPRHNSLTASANPSDLRGTSGPLTPVVPTPSCRKRGYSCILNPDSDAMELAGARLG
jgi:hypothetical protein